MLEILKPFASAHPMLFFWLALFVIYAVYALLTWPFRLVNRWIRHKNIVAKGWPPSHLDADGDKVD